MVAMGTGQYIFEIFGIVVVGFGAFLLTRIFALAPLQRDLTKMESTCHFCFIPVLVYSSFRLYFGILFHFTKSLSNKRPHVGKFGQISWKCLFGLLFLLLLCLLEGLNVFVSMFLILISLISFVYLFFRCGYDSTRDHCRCDDSSDLWHHETRPQQVATIHTFPLNTTT